MANVFEIRFVMPMGRIRCAVVLLAVLQRLPRTAAFEDWTCDILWGWVERGVRIEEV